MCSCQSAFYKGGLKYTEFTASLGSRENLGILIYVCGNQCTDILMDLLMATKKINSTGSI